MSPPWSAPWGWTLSKPPLGRPSFPCWLLALGFVVFWWVLSGLVFGQLVGLVGWQTWCVVAAHATCPLVYLLTQKWTSETQARAFDRAWAAGQGLGLLYLLLNVVF